MAQQDPLCDYWAAVCS